MTLPLASRTSLTTWLATWTPSLAKVANAVAWLSGLTSAAPSGMRRAVALPARALRRADGLGHLDHLLLALAHLADHVDEGGVDRVGGGPGQGDGGAVLVGVLVADRLAVARRGEGVAVEGGVEAESVLQAGGQGVRLEGRGGRARGGGPVAGVLDVVGTAVEGEHLAGVDVDRGDRGVQVAGLAVDRVRRLLGVGLRGLDRGVLRLLVEGRGDLEPAAADLGLVEAGRAELAFDHLEQEALGAAVALVDLDLGELGQLLAVGDDLGLA